MEGEDATVAVKGWVDLEDTGERGSSRCKMTQGSQGS